MAEQNTLPAIIVSKVDIIRLKAELEKLNETMHQAKLKGEAAPPPKASEMLEEFAVTANGDLRRADDREKLHGLLNDVAEHAPVVHISFAVSPSPSFLQKITQWFRKEIHPNTLLQVGLQPSIAAGCVVRTSNKYFDFSLRKHIIEKQAVLLEKLRGVTNEQQK